MSDSNGDLKSQTSRVTYYTTFSISKYVFHNRYLLVTKCQEIIKYNILIVHPKGFEPLVEIMLSSRIKSPVQQPALPRVQDIAQKDFTSWAT